MSISTKLEALVEPDWIASRLGDPSVRIVEVDVSPAAFDAGHIPGAVFWNAYGDLRPVAYRPLGSDEFAGLLSRSGIGPDTTIVFYGYAAHLGSWLMRSYGHSDVCLMDGSRERWLEAGYAWSTCAAAPAPASYPLDGGRRDLVTLREVVGLIGDPDAALLDVRSREEFSGERFWPSGGMQEGGRAGHIPGAVWLPVDIASDGASDGDPEGVREACAAAGAGPDRHVVVYCTIGNRASRVWYLLRHVLGYSRVSVYYGSWAEWGTALDTPVETGAARG